MKIMNLPTSPFGRKAVIVAMEHGLNLEYEECNPFDSVALKKINPLSLIPVLILDDGSILHDSHVICEYLDSIGTGPTLCPKENEWEWRTRAMVGHGLAESSVQLRLQQVLPENEQSSSMIDRYNQRIDRCLSLLDDEVSQMTFDKMRMDKICTIIGLGHLEFRHGSEWKDRAQSLASWYEAERDRPSIAQTAPM